MATATISFKYENFFYRPQISLNEFPGYNSSYPTGTVGYTGQYWKYIGSAGQSTFFSMPAQSTGPTATATGAITTIQDATDPTPVAPRFINANYLTGSPTLTQNHMGPYVQIQNNDADFPDDNSTGRYAGFMKYTATLSSISPLNPSTIENNFIVNPLNPAGATAGTPSARGCTAYIPKGDFTTSMSTATITAVWGKPQLDYTHDPANEAPIWQYVLGPGGPVSVTPTIEYVTPDLIATTLLDATWDQKYWTINISGMTEPGKYYFRFCLGGVKTTTFPPGTVENRAHAGITITKIA